MRTDAERCDPARVIYVWSWKLVAPQGRIPFGELMARAELLDIAPQSCYRQATTWENLVGRADGFPWMSDDPGDANPDQGDASPRRHPGGSAEPPDTPANRAFVMLSALAGMHFKPDERNEPFGPMVVFADGRRSAVPSDFRAHVDLLAAMAERVSRPVLRARLSDVCWLLDRKRGKLALAAIAAYTDTVQKTDDGKLKYRFASG
jgi:hypothetical protein